MAFFFWSKHARRVQYGTILYNFVAGNCRRVVSVDRPTGSCTITGFHGWKFLSGGKMNQPVVPVSRLHLENKPDDFGARLVVSIYICGCFSLSPLTDVSQTFTTSPYPVAKQLPVFSTSTLRIRQNCRRCQQGVWHHLDISERMGYV